MNLNPAIFAPIENVWADESRGCATQAGAKVAEFCTSIELLTARLNSTIFHRLATVATLPLLVRPCYQSFTLNSPHTNHDIKNGFCQKRRQLVSQNPGTKFTGDARNRLQNKGVLQFGSKTKIGVLSAPIVFAISGSKRSELLLLLRTAIVHRLATVATLPVAMVAETSCEFRCN